MDYTRNVVKERLEAQPTSGTTRWLGLDLGPEDTAWNADSGSDYTGPGHVSYGLYGSGHIYSGFTAPDAL